LAEPDTVVISEATYHLVHGLFACQALAPQEIKGFPTPLTVHRVLGASGAQSRFEVAIQAGLTPLVGRDEELALLRRRWQQTQEGSGQVVLLSGEPGIGKSRLVQELKDHVAQDGAVRIEYRCSPYHLNSAFYPLIEHLQRVLQFTTGDTSQGKLHKLEQTLSRYRFPQNDTMPLLASLLSLPLPEGSPPLSLTPQQQKQKTLDTLVRWLFEETERVPVYAVWEDLHWADPSTLEFLTVCLDQTPTTRMLMVLTGRPELPRHGPRARTSVSSCLAD
jgi:predicted ATPase